MKTKKAKKPRYTTVVTRWMYDDKSRARLIARAEAGMEEI